ncbi:MAG: nucleotide exchange factor GrpE [Methanobacteriota archaeon]|nr:MAG: nucleotide exchange factor GrpE [Euryarchaeota archaeon]
MQEEPEDSLPSNDEPGREDTADRGGEADPLAASKKELGELTDTLKRTQAEFENYKKRVERDAANMVQLASARLVSDLLSVLDTLDKAIEGADSTASENPSRDGVEGIRKQLMQVLMRAGVTEIDTEGQFDPFVHEAMMREEADSIDEGTILEVFQKGYMLGPKVLRTAKVKVSVDVRSEGAEHDGDQITGQDEESDEEER